MPKTNNIKLNLTEEDSTLFKDWRSSIDGNNIENKSNMQLIDEAFGQTQRIFIYKNISVTFNADTTYSDYPYRGNIMISNVTSDDNAEVTFNLTEANSGDYAPVCQTLNGMVCIYSKIGSSITVPLVRVFKLWQ